MRVFIDSSTDPYFNLAAEEFFLDFCGDEILRLWRNSPSVIIGRYQNAAAEVNLPFLRERNIPVVRRLTGGGAVYHDLGNINFTFVQKRVQGEETAAMLRRFTAPVISALRDFGADAAPDGRNDILVKGMKVSGNAVCVRGERVLHHGTLLFSASVDDISSALAAAPDKFEGKAVKSVRARVTNIRDHIDAGYASLAPEQFIAALAGKLTGSVCGADGRFTEGRCSASDLKAIEELRDRKYRTDEWNFGKSPRCTFHNRMKFPCGTVGFTAEIAGGRIKACRFSGDYFFTRPTEELCIALTGTEHTPEAVLALLSRFDLTPYFGPVTASGIASLVTG